MRRLDLVLLTLMMCTLFGCSRGDAPPAVVSEEPSVAAGEASVAADVQPKSEIVEQMGEQASLESPAQVEGKTIPAGRKTPRAVHAAPALGSTDVQTPRQELTLKEAPPDVSAPVVGPPPDRENLIDQPEPDSEEFAFPEPTIADTPPAPDPVVVPSPPRRQQASLAEEAEGAVPDLIPASSPDLIELPEGTVLSVRLLEALSSERNRSGDRFLAALDGDLVVEGRTVLGKGAVIEGTIVQANEAGKVKGKASLTMALSAIRVADASYAIETNEITLEAEGSKGRDAAAVGAATAIGAVLGGIFGGKKGAAVGAASGAGAGTAGVLFSRGRQVELEKERLFSFRLEGSVEMGRR